MSDTQDESATLIQDIEKKLDDVVSMEEPTVEQKIERAVERLANDMHRRFIEIERTVGINR